MKNTNLQGFINSLEKAKNEEMMVMDSTENNDKKDYVVVNNNKGYLVNTENNIST